MVGDFENKKNKGIIPRSFDYIFSEIEKDKEHKYNVLVSFIQIYLESIQDLLEPKNKDIRIREDNEHGVYLEGVQWMKVRTTNECAQIFHYGEKNRVTESTKMNSHSSRSHAILIVQIEKNIMLSKEKINELSKESNEKIKSERVMTKSNLYLVDLAGSERVKKTKAENMRLEEAKKINYSLLVLGNCIQSLTEKNPSYIAYRDSKLTRLLQESLGGNAKTSLIVTISPSGYNTDETISSLNFALRAMKVQNKPIINKSVDYQALCIKLQEDFDKLTDQYTSLKIEYDKVCEENNQLKNGEKFVELQRNSIVNNLNNNINEKNKFELAKDSKVKSNNKNLSEEDKKNFEKEMKKLEDFYEEMLKKKTSEYESVLKDVDKIISEKENAINTLTEKNKSINNKLKSQIDMVNDLKIQNEDLMNSVSDLTNKLNFEKEIKESKSEEAHKAELEKLNNQIEILEKKIIPLENMNSLNSNSINNFKQKIEDKIKELKTFKNNLSKEKSNLIIKTSQNEIKIKIDSDELVNINKKLETVSDEMKKILLQRKENSEKDIIIRKNENLNLGNQLEEISNNLENIDNDVTVYKSLKDNLLNMKNDDIEKMDKTELLCNSLLNETYSNVALKKLNINNKKVKKAEEDYEKLKKNFNDLKIEQEILNKENEELKQKEKDYLNQIKEKQNDKEKLESLNHQIEENKNLIEEKEKLFQDNIKKQKENEANLLNKDKLIETLNKENSSMKNNLKIIKKELNDKELDLKGKNEQINSLNNLIENDYKLKITHLESQIETLSSDLQSKEKIINDSINANESVNKKIQERELQISKYKTEQDNKEKTVQNLNNKLINTQQLLDTQKEESKKLKNENEKLKEQISSLNKLNDNISNKDDKIKKLENDNSEKEKEILSSKQEIINKQMEINELKNRYNEILTKNEKLQLDYKKLFENSKNSDDKNNILINDMTNKIEEHEKQLKENIQTINNLKTEKSNLEKEIKNNNEINESLNNQLKIILAQKEDELQSFTKNKNDSEAKLKSLLKEKEKEQNEYSNQLKKLIKEKEIEKEEYTKKLNNLMKEKENEKTKYSDIIKEKEKLKNE